jgi:hypothetical protein
MEMKVEQGERSKSERKKVKKKKTSLFAALWCEKLAQ